MFCFDFLIDPLKGLSFGNISKGKMISFINCVLQCAIEKERYFVLNASNLFWFLGTFNWFNFAQAICFVGYLLVIYLFSSLFPRLYYCFKNFWYKLREILFGLGNLKIVF